MSLVGQTKCRLSREGVKRCRPGWQAVRRLHADQRGSATLEFALVVPVLLAFSLLLVQTVMMYRGLLVVEYAAFAAARKAIVVIPTQNGEEAHNEVAGSGSAKLEAIRRSAAWALVSIAGPGSAVGDADEGGGPLSKAVEAFLKASGDVPGAGWSERADGAMAYALERTSVRIARPVVTASDTVANEVVAALPSSGDGAPTGFTFAPRDSVVVIVSHDLCLNVPFAGRLLAEGIERFGSGVGDGTLPDGTPYTTVTTRQVMTLEGVIDTLPTPPWPVDENDTGVRRIPP